MILSMTGPLFPFSSGLMVPLLFPQPLGMVFWFLVGLAVGSFLNVVSDRLPTDRSLWGRSACDHCKKTLRWFELVPVISWAVQLGRCRRCRKGISIQYPVVELTTGIGFAVLAAVSFPSLAQFLAALVIFSSLLVIVISDVKFFLIPDLMVLTGSLAVLAFLLCSSTLSPSGLFLHFVTGLFSSLFFFILWRVTAGRGMGMGDVKLAFLLGFLLGYPGAVVAFYLAFLTGALSGVILILGKRLHLKSRMPFGPFMIAGALIALLWGEEILVWWRTIV